ncbi:hypothetical protein [Mycobacterium sp. shizuoka-1]|uniref:hypothetical protein n=1 Tax=Mycobacterium sp. shizuoka-1 TaxID=2039281 RepID=UPI000C0638EC|nr:hypothetical protein [Mycobacterium sp. shizuoka-1]GAY14941.1 hypothetical protein MSZK_16670 [Mycobacterium sp. shizuoka-1]
MESVRDILEVFGAIDRAVREADDPDVSAAAEKLLPGLMAADPGWYTELETRYFPDDVRRQPNLEHALQAIASYDADQDTGRLTPAQKARLLYGISASERLRSVASASLPALSDSGSDFDDALVGSLAAIAPRESSSAPDRRSQAAAARDDVLQTAAAQFVRAADFNDVVRPAVVASPIRDGKPMSAPLCQTAVVTVDGYRSVIVDTKFTSTTISLNMLKSIVNPFNWDEDYNKLFVAMQSQVPEILPDHWRRVLETVRVIGDATLRTPLKFYPYQVSPVEAQMNYDLDMSNFAAGDGQVRVDRGFINMKSTVGNPAENGVRVTTRKVVHIQGISAFAQARLVCIGGYGTASADFLLGAAANPPASPAPFDYPTTEGQADPTAAGAQTAAPAPPATPMTHFVPAAVDAWTECAQDLTNGYFDVAQKWLAGSLTLTDLADYTTRLGGELASSPWKYLQAMTTPRSPGKPGSTT